MEKREDIRNIAIIAHVDHGKTTLVDGLLKQAGVFRDNQVVENRVMDSDAIEKERGITILSKNTAINYRGIKINIIDTPGHADFGGEVERVLDMCDGVVLVVDAFEGPMPQTKFVLRNAIELNLPAIICINKIDREGQRADEIMDEIIDLFIAVDADEKYLDSPIIYASAKDGWASKDKNVRKDNLIDLLDTIVDYIPAPEGEIDKPFKVLISTNDYNDYVGRIGIGRVETGIIKKGEDAYLTNYINNKKEKIRLGNIYEFNGLERVEVEESKFGSIVAISGIDGIEIGDTITSMEDATPLPFVKISEPTMSINFLVNDSPFRGEEGVYGTSRQLRKRLFKETETDVSLRVEETERTDEFKVSGRGELHLSILIENMRREGYEFQISNPKVIFKEINGVKNEPIELTTIDVDSEFSGTVIEELSKRKGELKSMETASNGLTRLVFEIPTRGLIGYRTQFLTDTKGTGVINTEFKGYSPYKGDIESRKMSSIISFETGIATAYGINVAQERGEMFIEPSDKVYGGEVVGITGKGVEVEVKVNKEKKLTNMRASGSDEGIKLTPKKEMTLEMMMEFVEDDELIEVTPKSLRIRKRILDSKLRKKSHKN